MKKIINSEFTLYALWLFMGLMCFLKVVGIDLWL